MPCDHTNWVYPPPYEDDWDGHMVYPEPHQVSSTKDLDTGRYQCTQCGKIMYYTGLWRDFYEHGIPCSGSDNIRLSPGVAEGEKEYQSWKRYAK